MDVFISWSGTQSRRIGETLKDWLPRVIQLVNPYFTPYDVEKGTRWSTDIASQLEKSEIGILCITAENIHSDWLLFEAGALSKSIEKARVCPILFGITNTDLSGPLKQFQTSEFKRNDIYKLINVINGRLNENKINQKTLEEVFDKFWTDLETEVNEILSKEDNTNEPIRSDRDILEEILGLSRSIAKNRIRPRIASEAIKELLIHYIDVHEDQVRQSGDYQSTLDKMKNMHMPLEHISHRYFGMSDDLDALINNFYNLSYKVNSSKANNIDDDDDIPF